MASFLPYGAALCWNKKQVSNPLNADWFPFIGSGSWDLTWPLVTGDLARNGPRSKDGATFAALKGN